MSHKAFALGLGLLALCFIDLKAANIVLVSILCFTALFEVEEVKPFIPVYCFSVIGFVVPYAAVVYFFMHLILEVYRRKDPSLLTR